MRLKRIYIFLILTCILFGLFGRSAVYAEIAPAVNFYSYIDYHSFAYDRLWPENHKYYNSDVEIILPDNFIYYEDISIFGEFSQFLTYDIGDNNYYYYVVDELQKGISIDIDNEDKNILRTEEVLSDSDINPADMRFSVNNVSGTYVADGIMYGYGRDGKLSKITWFENGISFGLSTYPELSTYPLDSSTAVAKLLNLETSSEVIPNAEDPEIIKDYLSESIEKFVEDWTCVAKGEKRDDLFLENWETKLVIPTLKKYDYEFSHVEAKGNNYWYEYYYVKKDDNTSNPEKIRISVRRKLNSFTTRWGDEYYMPSDDGVVMVSDSEFRLDYNTQMVTVYLPSSIKIEKAGDLRNYFDFAVIDVLNDKYPPDPAPPVDETPSWKMLVIIGSCAAVVAVAALGALVIVKKKKSK